MTSKNNLGITLRKKPKTNLKSLLFLYEMNFIRINEIVPGYDYSANLSYYLPEGKENLEVILDFQRDSKYTSTLRINQSESFNKRLRPMEISVAIYHDLKMAEVRNFNGKQLFWARNKYPNTNMFHKDEKYQWNKFLSEWLIFSKKEGLSKKILMNVP